MKKYTQTYSILNDTINNSRENIDILKEEEKKLKEEKKKITLEIANKKNKIYFLNCEKNEIISSKDRYIGIPMTLLTLLIELALLKVGYNIITLPLDGFEGAMAVLGTISIGGSLVIGIGLSMSYLTLKLKDKLHKKVLKNNKECSELSKEIAKENEKINNLHDADLQKENEINMILDRILHEKELIRKNSQSLQSIKKEILDAAFKTDGETLESSKAYARVKKQNNI